MAEWKKREIRKLGGSVKARPIRHLGPLPPEVEGQANADIAVLDKAIKTEEQLRKDRELAIGTQLVVDEGATDYWVALVFQTRDQRYAWLRWMMEKGLMPPGVENETFLSGTALAKAQGIVLPPGPKWRPEPVVKARWASMARELPTQSKGPATVPGAGPSNDDD